MLRWWPTETGRPWRFVGFRAVAATCTKKRYASLAEARAAIAAMAKRFGSFVYKHPVGFANSAEYAESVGREFCDPWALIALAARLEAARPGRSADRCNRDRQHSLSSVAFAQFGLDVKIR